VRLAAALVRDRETAEDVVQDAFIAMHTNWCKLRDRKAAAWYLRQCAVNRSRSVMRHREVAGRQVLQPPPDMPSAEQGAITSLERNAVAAALQQLPVRQREALVLRYYAGLSEAETASAMGISIGSVKRHTARALSALGRMLKREA
jgi:RNA polymerase sigma-70 factor (sigma-E family)